MKVILKGIDYSQKSNPDPEDMFNVTKFYKMLEQISFPLTIEADDQYPHAVCLKDYIKNTKFPDSKEMWGLVWFDYKIIKDENQRP